MGEIAGLDGSTNHSPIALLRTRREWVSLKIPLKISVQQEIQNAACDYQRRVETGDAIVVGVNRFTRENEPGVPTQRIDPELEQRQVERLRALRAKRSQSRWQQGIEAIQDRARNGGNLMHAILEAVESNCTVGEIAGTLRSVFAEYRETVVI